MEQEKSAAAMLTEERARAALHRAAQLQAEAADRQERQAQMRMLAQSAAGGISEGYRREDIEAAAQEAGIAVEHIRQALLEQEALGEAQPLAPWIDRMGVRMLGTRHRTLELVRPVRAGARPVLAALQRVATAPPYGMTLIDSFGASPLEGGVLVYKLPTYSSLSSAHDAFAYAAAAIDLEQLLITLRPHEVAGAPHCTIELRSDLRTSTKRNVWAGLALSGIGGGVTAAGAVAAALSSGLMLPLVAAAGAAGLLGGGAAGAAGTGSLYRYYLRKMSGELETMLRVIDVTARTAIE